MLFLSRNPHIAGTMLRVPLHAVLVTLVIASQGCALDSARRDQLRSQRPFLGPLERPVIIVPGFGVSRLKDSRSGEFVWGTPRNMVITQYSDDLDLPVTEQGDRSDHLVPDGFTGSRGPLNTAWQLSEGLRKYGGYDPSYRPGNGPANLFPFAWDWRRDVRHSAGELARFVDDVLERGDESGQVDVIAHSAGGIVVLTWLRTDPRASRLVRNVVLVGVPEGGTVDAIRVFARQEQFLRRRLDTSLLMTWPSLPQLLPDRPVTLFSETGEARPVDFRQMSGWHESGLIDGADNRLLRAWERSLAEAREWRAEFRRALPPRVRVTRIAGDCVPTPARPILRSDGTWAFYERDLRPEERRLGAMMLAPGDGTVTSASASAGDPTTLRFCDGHQGLASSPQVHRALVRTLRGWGSAMPAQ